MEDINLMTDYYVLDTSALLTDVSCLENFPNKTIVIPISVILELDKQKTRIDEIGKSARYIHKYLYNLTKQGDIKKGILDTNTNTKIMCLLEQEKDIPKGLNPTEADNRILSVCKTLQKQYKNKQITLVTNDFNLSLKASIYGVESLEFKGNNLVEVRGYRGHRRIKCTKYLNSKTFDASENNIITLSKRNKYKFFENECVYIKKSAKDQKNVIAIHKQGKLFKLKEDIRFNNIEAKNVEQFMLLNVLADPSISLVTITGLAGCGKSICAVAAGLSQVLGKNSVYEKLVISRSLEPLSGKDRIGFLKGTLDDKLAPYILPLKDAIDLALGGSRSSYEFLKQNGDKLEIEPLQYIRGRSMPNVFFIVDEAQNLTRKQVKAIITRMGEGSKVVLLGDIDSNQIDNIYVNSKTNGLSQTIEAFKNSKIAAHIELVDGVRSELASECAERL